MLMVSWQAMNPSNYLTIDVEDYYQVSAFESLVPKGEWRNYPSRVVQNTRIILAILEEYGVKATFFILGWTAENHPDLVKEIAAAGHEVGCHSYQHKLVYNQTPEEFRRDTAKAKDILEQICGKPVHGYRAPSYSITSRSLWALHILHELGFTYDSSIFPIHHDRYGIPSAPRYPFIWNLSATAPQINQIDATDSNVEKSNCLLEYPLSTITLLGKNIPVSGGGYFRLFPYWFTRYALHKINRRDKRQFVFYLHPWEFDPEQPRFNNASAFSRFRHYNNLAKTGTRFSRLLQDFSFKAMHTQPDTSTP
jgi:polysaccharide deacetylase family protein (PEP-CTERM system associated)